MPTLTTQTGAISENQSRRQKTDLPEGGRVRDGTKARRTSLKDLRSDRAALAPTAAMGLMPAVGPGHLVVREGARATSTWTTDVSDKSELMGLSRKTCDHSELLKHPLISANYLPKETELDAVSLRERWVQKSLTSQADTASGEVPGATPLLESEDLVKVPAKPPGEGSD